VDAAPTPRPALPAGPQRRANTLANGGEDDRGVETLRGHLVWFAGPHRAESTRELLGCAVAGPRECVHLAALVARDLRHDVRRGAKSIDPKPLRVTRFEERAITNQAGAEQRRGFGVGINIRQREAKAFVGHRILRVAAIERVARKT